MFVVPEPSKRLCEPNPAYEGNKRTVWVFQHLVYLPCMDFFSKAVIDDVARRTIAIYGRYMKYQQDLNAIQTGQVEFANLGRREMTVPVAKL